MRFAKKKPAEPAPRKGYLMMLDKVDAGPCTCSWVSLGGEPWSVNTSTVVVREGESLPFVDRGFVHYCPRHRGGSN